MRASARPLALEAPLPWPTQLLLVLGAGLLVGLVRLPLLYDWRTGQLAARTKMSAINHQFGVPFVAAARRLGTELSKTGGYVLDAQDYGEPFSYSLPVYVCGLYVAAVRNDINKVSLSQLDQDTDKAALRFPDRSAVVRQLIAEVPICRFYAAVRRRNPALTRPEAMRQFVTQHCINFVCVSAKAKLPSVLQPLVRKRFMDPLTGEQLFRLRC